jgi:hypothetical protein
MVNLDWRVNMSLQEFVDLFDEAINKGLIVFEAVNDSTNFIIKVKTSDSKFGVEHFIETE